MEAIVHTKSQKAILSIDKYSMFEDGWTLAIEAQDSQLVLTCAAVDSLSLSQLTGGPSLEIDLQTPEAVCLNLCFSLLCQR
jgi:hypothetical protein